MSFFKKIIIYCFFFVCLALSSCKLFLPKDANVIGLNVLLQGASQTRVGDPGLTNQQYSDRLENDGWPVQLLNTAAGSDYLTDFEKNVVLAHNLVRYDPRKYARLYVAEYLGYYKAVRFCYPGVDYYFFPLEGKRPVMELYNELQGIRSLPFLNPSVGLTRAALGHALHQSETGEIGHEGLGGTDDRIDRVGRWRIAIGENISYGSWSGHDAVLALLIDDGVVNRGHRKNILSDDFNEIGVAHAYHPKFREGVLVIKYAWMLEVIVIDD